MNSDICAAMLEALRHAGVPVEVTPDYVVVHDYELSRSEFARLAEVSEVSVNSLLEHLGADRHGPGLARLNRAGKCYSSLLQSGRLQARRVRCNLLVDGHVSGPVEFPSLPLRHLFRSRIAPRAEGQPESDSNPR